jgi:hypothetical protein
VLFIAPPGDYFLARRVGITEKWKSVPVGFRQSCRDRTDLIYFFFCTTQVIGGTGSFNQIKKIDRR